VFFPHAPTKRNFHAFFETKAGTKQPLCALISAVSLPPSISSPQKLLHWVACLDFSVSAKQEQLGLIQQWQPASMTLSALRGSVQDHAILLCNALKGLGRDAYVCCGSLCRIEFCAGRSDAGRAIV